MKANPGGQIDTKTAIGRDALICNLWDTVEQQSLIITAERRIGKTTVIKKMRDEPRPGWVPIYQDLEKCHSARDFAMLVYNDVHEFLGVKKKVARRTRQFFEALGGAEVGGVFKLPSIAPGQWKDVLSKSVEDLVHENDDAKRKLLFLWDEMPYMLTSIRDKEGEQTAMEVLDLLRSLRQTHAGLRMVITGSIGLHHVIGSLKEKNYANSPVNDMVAIEVQPLEEADATQLAGLLIEGENLPCVAGPAVAAGVARQADCFPFYIHHIVKALRMRGLEATIANVELVVAIQLVAAEDPWQLMHYRERIATYYRDDANTVILLLDELAAGKEAPMVNELLTTLKGASAFDDRERLLWLLSLMERDHYVHREMDGRYRFKFPLIKRWWKIKRGL